MELKRKEKRLLMEIARFKPNRVKANLGMSGRTWVYRADEGIEYLNLVVHEVRDTVKESGLVLLACSEGKKGGQVLIIVEDKGVHDLASKVQDILKGIRGGGKGGKWQGKVVE